MNYLGYVPYKNYKPISNLDNTKYVSMDIFSTQQGPDTCSIDKTCDLWKNNPKYWGPHLWNYIHYSTLNYPENPSPVESNDMLDWVCKLPITIPCAECRYHYDRYIKHHMKELQNACKDKELLFNFFVDVHNQVNKRNGKSELTYEEAREIYK